MVEVDSTPQSTKPRRRWLRWLAAIALAIVIFILGLRLAATVVPLETASGFLLAQWRDPVIHPFGYQPAAFYRADRVKHAKFWVAEAKRLARDDRASPQALMGGAWLLHNLTQQNTTPEVQQELWSTSLQLAALATEREPRNVDWWRLRARLAGTDRWSSLDDDWTRVFVEAAKHDPDNALYDYLAAYNIGWNTVRMANATGRQSPFIVEWEKFDKAGEFVANGLVKSVVACPNDQLPLILCFMEHSRQPRFALMNIYLHNGIDADPYPSLGYVYELHRRQLATAIAPDEGVKAYQKTLRMVKQCEDASSIDPLVARMKSEAIFGSWTADRESAPVEQEHYQSDHQRELLAAMAEETLAWKLAPHSALPRGGAPYKQLIPVVIGQMTMRPIELLILGALLLIVASWMVGRKSQAPRFGMLRHLLAWATGISMSILIFAVIPAQVLPDAVTTIVWSVGVFAPVAAVLCLPLFLLRTQRGRRSGVLLAVSLAIIAAVYGFAKWLRLDLQTVAASSVRLYRDPDLVDSISISNDPFRLQWALAQWDARHGLLIGILISLALVATWCVWRLTRENQQGFRDLWFRRPFAGWVMLFSILARSMFAAAVCLLVIYLALAPSAVREVEVACQTLEGSLRSMEPTPSLIEAIAKARGNAAELDRLLKQVDQGQLDPSAPAPQAQ